MLPQSLSQALALSLAFSCSSIAWAASDFTSASPVQLGFASGAAVGLSFADGSAGGGTDFVRISPPQSQVNPPAPFDPARLTRVPDWSLSSMFPGHTDIEIDAMSTGNDFIGPVSSTGEALLSVDGPRWQGVTVSVAADAVGLPTGSILTEEPLASLGSSGHLFTHYLDGSASGPGALPTELVGTTAVEQTSVMLGLDPSDSVEIDGLDWAMGIRSFAGGVPGGVVFNRGLDEFYFSVSQAWAAQNPTGFAVKPGGTSPVPTTGGDIYRITWGSGSWSTPERVQSGVGDLGLQVGEDLDALAYDAEYQTVLYSTAIGTGPARSQVLVFQEADSAEPEVSAVPYSGVGGRRITAALGLRDVSDDVEAICVIDPESGSSPDNRIGVRFEAASILPETVGLCVERAVDDLDQSTIHVQASFEGGLPSDTQAQPVVTVIVAQAGVVSPPVPMTLRGHDTFTLGEWDWFVGDVTNVGELSFYAILWQPVEGVGLIPVASSFVTILKF